MAKTKKPRIGSALEMQQQLEDLFFKAKEANDIKQTAYLGQVWASLETHASKERAAMAKSQERTALDDLVDILGDMRTEYFRRNPQQTGDNDDE